MKITKSQDMNGVSTHIKDFRMTFTSDSPVSIVFTAQNLVDLISIHIPEFHLLSEWKDLAFQNKILSQSSDLKSYFKSAFMNDDKFINYFSDSKGFEYDEDKSELYDVNPEAYRQLFVSTYKNALSAIYSEHKYYLYKMPIFSDIQYWTVQKDSVFFENDSFKFIIKESGLNELVSELKIHLDNNIDYCLSQMNEYIVNKNKENENKAVYFIEDYNGSILDEIKAIEQATDFSFDTFCDFFKKYFDIEPFDFGK